MYGPITSVSTTFLATAVMFDLDFKKNFEPTIASRFGPPIVTVPNRNPNLRVKLTIGTSNSETDVGIGTSLDFFIGRNGFAPVAGVVGGYHSAISMPVAALAANLKIPQVSWGSTSPKLSNKAQYPYFMRTIPPDSIQGAGMWQFIVHFSIPSVTFCYATEAYGEGLFQTVGNLASVANEAFRVNGAAVEYQPGTYDLSKAESALTVVKAMGTKFIYLAMTTDQASPFAYVMEQQGMLGSDWQLVGSEAVKILPSGDNRPSAGSFPAGFVRFNPIARGSMFSKFADMWYNMTADDIMGSTPQSYYKIDQFRVSVANGKAAAPTDAMFANLNAYQLEDPFIFDACYCFVMAFNEMVNEGVDLDNIKGQALLDKVRAVDFTGISGQVAFNGDGDRLAAYTIDNIQPSRRLSADGERQLAATTLVTVAEFNSATSTITQITGQTMLWMTGDSQWTVPGSLVACLPGYKTDPVTLMCVACPDGWSSLGGAQATCTRCTPGNVANAASAATACVACTSGTYASEGGTTQCVDCEAGKYSNAVGANSCTNCAAGKYQQATGQITCMACSAGNFSSSGSALCEPCALGYVSLADSATTCTPCPQGEYQDVTGMSACKKCPAKQNTLLLGSTGIAECRCEEGFWRQTAADACQPCGEGMECPYGSEMDNYWAWQNAGRPASRPATQIFPLLKMRYATIETEPLNVYSCRDQTRCPGGPPGTCGPNLQTSIISCARCSEDWYWDGEKCVECSAVEASSILFPVIPLAIAPVVISVMYFFFRDDIRRWGSWQNGCAALVFILLNHFQITVLASSANIQFPTSVTGYFTTFAFSDDFLSLFKPQCAGMSDFQKATAIRTCGPIILAVLFALTFAGSYVIRAVTKLAVAMDVNRTINIYLSIILTFFAGIVSMCFTIFKCHDNPVGKRTLNKDESIICGEDTWNSMLVFALFSILFYIVGFGCLIIRTIIIAPANFNNVVFQRRWKFLFIKYRPDAWWWIICFCMKGLVMNIGYIFLETGIAQINWIMAITGVYCGMGIYFMPWRHRAANLVEVYVHITLLFVLSWLTWFAHDAIGVDAGKISDDLSVVLIITNVSTIFAGMGAGGYYAYRANGAFPAKMLDAASKLSYEAYNELGQIAFEDYDTLIKAATEWDRHDLIKAAMIIRVEFMGKNGEVRRASPGVEKKLSDMSFKGNKESHHHNMVEPEGEPVKQEKVVMSENEKLALTSPRTPRQDMVSHYDNGEIPADSHYTPRGINSRLATSPRCDILRLDTPRSQYGTPPATPRQTPRSPRDNGPRR